MTDKDIIQFPNISKEEIGKAIEKYQEGDFTTGVELKQLMKDVKLPEGWDEGLDKLWAEEGHEIKRPEAKSFLSEEEVQANADFMAIFIMFETIYRRRGKSPAKRFARLQEKIIVEVKQFVDLEEFQKQLQVGKLARYNNVEMIQTFVDVIKGF